MKKSTKADLVLVLVVSLWGTSFALVKGALDYVTPALFVLLRFLIAGGVWGVLYHRRLREVRPGTWWRGLVLGAVLGGGFIMQTAGLELTTASMSGFITGLNVIIVPLLVVLLERRLPRWTAMLGVALCTVGLWVMTAPEGAGLNTGDVLTIGCAFLFALYIVLVEIFTGEEGYDSRALALIQVFGVFLVTLPALPLLEVPRVHFTWAFTWRWIVLGTMAAVTLALQLHWQRFITATRAAIIFTLEPPLAALFAFMLLGEILVPAAYAGGALIFLGMLVAEGGARLFPAGRAGGDLA
ncbi:MAG: DMT family transporter [bacterium]